MQTVNLNVLFEDLILNGEFIKTEVEGKKVKLTIALSDTYNYAFDTTFVMEFNLGNFDSFMDFACLVEEFFDEQPKEFNVDDFLGKKCEAWLTIDHFGDCADRKIKSIKYLKTDYKGITQDKKTTALSEGLEEKKREISALVSRLGHPQA